MPRFAPFRGLRYHLGRVDLADVTAPPYDVLDADQRAALLARDPRNVVAVDLPVPPGTDPAPGTDPYAGAAATLEGWRRQGLVVQDAEAAFYAYRTARTDGTGRHRRTTGVLGALELSPPGQAPPGGQPVLPHEQTTPKARSDRLELLRATGTNLSAVWGLSATPGLTGLLEAGEPPLAAWTDDAGTSHELWALVDRDRLAAIGEAVAASPVVIADGHHRYETALAYQAERRGAGGAPERRGADQLRPWDATLAWVVELSEDELAVAPIHRLLRGLPAHLDLAAALAPAFEVGPLVPPITVGDASLVLVTPTGDRHLRPRPEAMAGVRDLDTSRLDVALAGLPPHEVTFQHGEAEVRAAVAGGAQQAGVLLRPATVAQILDIAHGGERMPPKTTFFHPKPATGTVLRPAS